MVPENFSLYKWWVRRWSRLYEPIRNRDLASFFRFWDRSFSEIWQILSDFPNICLDKACFIHREGTPAKEIINDSLSVVWSFQFGCRCLSLPWIYKSQTYWDPRDYGETWRGCYLVYSISWSDDTGYHRNLITDNDLHLPCFRPWYRTDFYENYRYKERLQQNHVRTG